MRPGAKGTDLSRRRGYYLHMNGDGGEALRRCLPADLFELYAETSRITPERRESIVLDDQLAVLSSQPHLGPPNERPRPHTGVHRRTLRQILLARLGDSLRPGRAAASCEERPDGVILTLDDGSTSQGDVLVGADGIRSAIRGQRLPGVRVIDAGVRGLGVYGRSPLTPEIRDSLPPLLLQGVIIAADRRGSRMLLAAPPGTAEEQQQLGPLGRAHGQGDLGLLAAGQPADPRPGETDRMGLSRHCGPCQNGDGCSHPRPALTTCRHQRNVKRGCDGRRGTCRAGRVAAGWIWSC